MEHESGSASEDQMRLFFGFEVHTPWPESFPEGRMIDPKMRHLTFLFLGSQTLPSDLDAIPRPPFQVGKVGYFSKCDFLPYRHANAVSWLIEWLEKDSDFTDYQEKLYEWCQSREMDLQPLREDLPHVTLARKPFAKKEWKKSFVPLPCYLGSLHLFHSLQASQYESLWSAPFLAPFTEIDHTADVAFTIRGESLDQLYINALTALLFEHPPLLEHVPEAVKVCSHEEIVAALNRYIAHADQDVGVPFKAISFANDVRQQESGLYEWEMIIDV